MSLQVHSHKQISTVRVVALLIWLPWCKTCYLKATKFHLGFTATRFGPSTVSTAERNWIAFENENVHIVLPCLSVCLSVCLPSVTDGLKLCSECSSQLCVINVCVYGLFLFNNVIYVFLLLWLCVLTVCLCMTILTEGFPCIFLSCKANVKVKLAKTGHGPHSS
jgi:hypothetical protein